MELKMYCVFSKTAVDAMKGSRGKLAAQAGHAYLHAYWDSVHRFPKLAWAYEDSPSAVKICLVVPGEEELRALETFYSTRCGVSLVTDSARTVFDQPTVTCLGIGPISPYAMEENLRMLPTLT